MQENKKLCIAVYVFGVYTKYIPFYIYSILRAYPNYFVKVFCNETITESERKALTLIKGKLSDHFEVLENYGNEYNYLNQTNMIGGGQIAMRWLLPERFFSEFDYVYIGDVDFLIFREDPSLLEFHIDNCNRLDLPFSNAVRVKNGLIEKRLTGLHFYATKPYYNALNDRIHKLLFDKKLLFDEINKHERNEHFLFNLVKDAIEFDPEVLSFSPRPWHGLHLGVSRNQKDKITYETFLTIEALNKEIKALLKDELFINLIRISPIIELFRVFRSLSIRLPFLLYPLHIFYVLRDDINRIRNTLKIGPRLRNILSKRD